MPHAGASARPDLRTSRWGTWDASPLSSAVLEVLRPRLDCFKTCEFPAQLLSANDHGPGPRARAGPRGGGGAQAPCGERDEGAGAGEGPAIRARGATVALSRGSSGSKARLPPVNYATAAPAVCHLRFCVLVLTLLLGTRWAT